MSNCTNDDEQLYYLSNPCPTHCTHANIILTQTQVLYHSIATSPRRVPLHQYTLLCYSLYLSLGLVPQGISMGSTNTPSNPPTHTPTSPPSPPTYRQCSPASMASECRLMGSTTVRSSAPSLMRCSLQLWSRLVLRTRAQQLPAPHSTAVTGRVWADLRQQRQWVVRVPTRSKKVIKSSN